MNELMIFKNEEFGQVRTMEIEGKPYFVGRDIAGILGYSNPQKAIRDHCKGVNEMGIPSKGGIQKMKLIPEGDIYRLIIKSKLPQAEKFESWVMDVVLPAIRKDGAYIKGEEKVVSGELSEDELVFQAMNIMNKKISRLNEEKKELQLQNNKMKPIVGLIDKFISNDNCWDIGVLAKSLECQDMGKNKLFKWLRNTEILMANNIPYQRYVNYFKVVPTVLWNGDTHYKTLVRANGVKYIYNRLVKDGKVIEKSLEDILEYLTNDN